MHEIYTLISVGLWVFFSFYVNVIKLSSIWINSLLPIGPIRFFYVIFPNSKEFSTDKDKEKYADFHQKILATTVNFKLPFQLQKLNSLFLSSQSLIRNWQSWIWWPVTPVFHLWTVAAFLCFCSSFFSSFGTVLLLFIVWHFFSDQFFKTML